MKKSSAAKSVDGQSESDKSITKSSAHKSLVERTFPEEQEIDINDYEQPESMLWDENDEEDKQLYLKTAMTKPKAIDDLLNNLINEHEAKIRELADLIEEKLKEDLFGDQTQES